MVEELRDPLDYLLESLEDPQMQDALKKIIKIIKNLEESGILEMLETITDPQVFERIMQLVLTTGIVGLGDKIETFIDVTRDIVSTLGKPVEPISPTGLLTSLRDPDVARGLAKFIQILKIIGRLSENV